MVNWSGRTSAYQHKFDDWQTKDVLGAPPAFQTMKVLFAQWTLCPVEVEDEVKLLWRMMELGNDNSYHRTSIAELVETTEDETRVEIRGKMVDVKFDNLIEFARINGLGETEEFLINWWW